MNRITATIAAAGLAASLAACGSAEAPAQPAAAATSSVSASTSATPATWSKGEAGTRYLAIVAPLNAAAKQFPKTTDTSAWHQWVKACKKVPPLVEAQMRALEAGDWPDAVRPAIDDLINENAQLRTWAVGCSQMKSEQDSWGLPQLPPATAAQKVRLKLGLPAPAAS